MKCETTAFDYRAQAAQEDAQSLMHVSCDCIGNYNIMHTLQATAAYLLNVNQDISHTQALLLADPTTLLLHDEGLGEHCSLSGFKCRALIKRATSYTIFKPPHKKKLQHHM